MELWESALPGTKPQWVLLVILLPFVGHAVAASWGPRGHRAAQRALLLLVAYLTVSLVLAWPTFVVPFFLACLPVIGGAIGGPEPTVKGDALAWPMAAAFCAPAVTLSYLGPYGAAPVLFLGLLGLAVLRGVADPSYDFAVRAWAWARERVPALRERWRVPVKARGEEPAREEEARSE